MKFAHRLAHLVFPRESNNQKAKLLHSSTITVFTLCLILIQLVLAFIPRLKSQILGYAANISPEEVVRLTNEKRAENGLEPLSLNSTLSSAAQAKGADMLNKDYWAHVAPDGTQPWKFFIDFGYKYRYAGENLARDFSNPQSAVDAWMASPSHKENMLSPKYKEMGIAVVEGDLAGVDTTVIVQFFGTKYTEALPVAPIAQITPTSTIAPVPTETVVPTPTIVVTQTPQVTPTQLTVLPTTERPTVLISPFSTTKTVSIAIVGVLLAVLIIDGIVTSRRRIARIGGRTFAHLSFLGMILAIVLILKAGQVL
jgi:hypothetical protein